jgi:hypothetical protein
VKGRRLSQRRPFYTLYGRPISDRERIRAKRRPRGHAGRGTFGLRRWAKQVGAHRLALEALPAEAFHTDRCGAVLGRLGSEKLLLS